MDSYLSPLGAANTAVQSHTKAYDMALREGTVPGGRITKFAVGRAIPLVGVAMDVGTFIGGFAKSWHAYGR